MLEAFSAVHSLANFGRRVCAIILIAAGLTLLGLTPITAQTQARSPAVGWRHWQLGDLTLELPESWVAQDAPSPLDMRLPAWNGVAFAERPASVEAGALLVLAWGTVEGGYALGLDPDDIIGGSAVPVAGRTAGRVDFQVHDKRNDTRGFDVVIGPQDAGPDESVTTSTLTVTCRGPSRDWPRIEALCAKIMATLTLQQTTPEDSASAASPARAAAAPGAAAASTGAKTPNGAVKPAMPPPASARRLIIPSAPMWRATSWGRGRTDFVEMSAMGTRVRFPADAGGGGSGITSTHTAVRLGDLSAGAQTTLTFRFDPNATDGWRISLCPARLDSCWSERGYTLFWQPAATAGQWQLLRKSNDGKHREIATVQRVSSELKLRLSAAGVEVSGGDIVPAQDNWELLNSFLGFEISVEAVPIVEGAGQSFSLTAIDIDERHPEAASIAQPVAGIVEPLPNHRLLAGAPGPQWSAIARAGGDAAFIGDDDVVRVPKGRGAGWTGYSLRQPTIDVPAKASLSPRRLRIATAPETTTGFAVVLSVEPEPADPWLQSKIWVQWSGSRSGGGTLTLANCASGNRQVSMKVPEGWDGTLEILLQDGLVEVGLDPRWRIAGASSCVAKDNQFRLSIFAAPEKENEAAVMSLRRVEVDRVTPPGMTAQQRFELLDDEDFDPIEFLDALAHDIKGRAP